MKNKTQFLWFLVFVVLLVVAATGTLYRGRFVGQGTTPHFTGHGGGLTNLSGVSNFTQNITFETNVILQQTLTVKGNATFTSNFFIYSLSFATNAGAVNVLNLNCTDQAIATNNNINFGGFNIPAEFGVTNSAWAAVLITNNGALATISLFFPGCIGDTNILVTNQASFFVKKYPGFGTNVVFNSLK